MENEYKRAHEIVADCWEGLNGCATMVMDSCESESFSQEVHDLFYDLDHEDTFWRYALNEGDIATQAFIDDLFDYTSLISLIIIAIEKSGRKEEYEDAHHVHTVLSVVESRLLNLHQRLSIALSAHNNHIEANEAA